MGTTKYVIGQELYHHGIKGQKWGVRNYQNPDGSLTSAGRERYGESSRSIKKLSKKIDRLQNKSYKTGSSREETRVRKMGAAGEKLQRRLIKSESKTISNELQLEKAKKLREVALPKNRKQAERLEAASNRGKTMAQAILGGTISSAAVTALINYKSTDSGKKKALAILSGALSGAEIGAIVGAAYIAKGNRIAKKDGIDRRTIRGQLTQESRANRP